MQRRFARCELCGALTVLALQASFALIEVFACSVRMGAILLREWHRIKFDTVDRAGWYAQLAAAALLGNYAVHLFAATDNGVHRADLDALGAANAVGLDDARKRAWCLLAA